MYKNVGRSIKNIVKALVTIQIILYSIAGLICLFASGSGVGLLLCILIVGIGCFSAWVSGLVLYAYGEIADALLCIKKKLGAEEIDEQESVLGTAPAAAKQDSTDSARKEKNLKGWVCYSCGTENRGSVSYCVKCGTNKAWSEGKQNSQ